MSGAGYFLYFAFGSNLLKERLHLQNPSAVFHSVARLKGYVLQFGLWGENVVSRWNGGVATIEECADKEVWGVVWKMATEDFTSLDKESCLLLSAVLHQPCNSSAFLHMACNINVTVLHQPYNLQEGVDKGFYSPMEVTVEAETGPLLCRTYKMNNFSPCAPSPSYKEVFCLGAQQNGLPEDYIKMLKAVETNTYTGPSILDRLILQKN